MGERRQLCMTWHCSVFRRGRTALSTMSRVCIAAQAIDLLAQLTRKEEGDSKRPHLTGGLDGVEIAQVVLANMYSTHPCMHGSCAASKCVFVTSSQGQLT